MTWTARAVTSLLMLALLGGPALAEETRPAGGRSYFFVPVSRFGAGYRVSVIRFDRLEMQ